MCLLLVVYAKHVHIQVQPTRTRAWTTLAWRTNNFRMVPINTGTALHRVEYFNFSVSSQHGLCLKLWFNWLNFTFLTLHEACVNICKGGGGEWFQNPALNVEKNGLLKGNFCTFFTLISLILNLCKNWSSVFCFLWIIINFDWKIVITLRLLFSI